jgi:hypothetical protein
MNSADGGFMRSRADVDEMIERSDEASSDFASIIDAVRIGKNFKSLMVMPLEHFSHEKGGGVLFEIAGQIANANAPRLTRAGENGDGLGRKQRGRPVARADQLLIRRRVSGDEREGRDSLAGPHEVPQLVFRCFEILPVAKMALFEEEGRNRRGEIRIDA